MDQSSDMQILAEAQVLLINSFFMCETWLPLKNRAKKPAQMTGNNYMLFQFMEENGRENFEHR